jgi:hypothetical protein
MARELRSPFRRIMEQQPEVLNNSADDTVSFELGLGRRQAFGLIAGKTAAADIECMRQIRDGNLFRAKGVDWSGFCQKYAGVTSSYANRLIRQFDEFGPNYFDLSKILRISAESYRKIKDSVGDEGIDFGGEKIAISPENSDKIAEAVKALREQAGDLANDRSKPAERAVAAARRRLLACVAELTKLFEAGLEDGDREELANAVSSGLLDLRLLSLSLDR